MKGEREGRRRRREGKERERGNKDGGWREEKESYDSCD